MKRTSIVPLLLSFLIIDAACAAEPAPYTKNVAIVVWNGVELLDFGGPGEVFAASARFGASNGQPAFRVFTVAPTADTVISQGFLRIQPQYTIDNAPKADIIVFPGGSNDVLTNDPRFMKWAGKAVAESEIALSVCTGAFVLARLDLLDGLDVTTYYGAIAGLRSSTPKARVHDGRRFIDSGKYVTTAGVSAGIDGSLHVVARLLGRAVADRTAQYMEYRWTPETYLASSYALLNPRLDDKGRMRQQANYASEGGRLEEAETAYRTLLRDQQEDGRTWLSLAYVLHRQSRWNAAAEAFTKAANSADLRTEAYYGAACSLARGKESERAIAALEKAIANDNTTEYARAIAGDEDLVAIRNDPRVQKLASKR